MREEAQQAREQALHAHCDTAAVPAGLWPGSEAESGAGQQKGQGWPTVGSQGLHQEGLEASDESIRIHSSSGSAHLSEFLPCLFPCTIGFSNIFRAAGLLRPVSICMTVGSGRSPFPRLTASKGSRR